MKQIALLALVVTCSLTPTTQLFAQEDTSAQRRGQAGGRGGPRGEMPPELKAQLSTEQLELLKNATSMEERKSLLKSWGISPPPRPKRGEHKPPSEEVSLLFEKHREAISESDSEVIRDQLRDLYKISTNENDREEIRRFFARHPSSVSQSNGSSFRPLSNSSVTQ